MSRNLFIISLILFVGLFSCVKVERDSEHFDAAMISYDSGFYYHSNGIINEALPYYFETANLLEVLPEEMSHKDMNLTARAYHQMGMILSRYFQHRQSIDAYKQAYYYENIIQDTIWLNRTRLQLAREFNVMKEVDTSEYYLNQVTYVDPGYEMEVTRLRAKYCYDRKDYEEAFRINKEIISEKHRAGIPTNSDSIGLGILMYHSPYKLQSKPYLQKVFAMYDDSVTVEFCAIVALLAEIYKLEGNADSLAICSKFFGDYAKVESEVQSKGMKLDFTYDDFVAKRNERLNNLLEEKNNRRKTMLISVIVASVVLLSSIIIVKIKRTKKGNPDNNTEELIRAFGQSAIIQEIKTRLQSVGITKITTKNIEDFSDMALSNSEMLALRDAADAVMNGLMSRLMNQYPKLTSADVACCCLVLSGFSNAEMAALFGVKYNALNARIAKIKKTFDIEGSLRDFIVQNIR
mgnify:FL=1